MVRVTYHFSCDNVNKIMLMRIWNPTKCNTQDINIWGIHFMPKSSFIFTRPCLNLSTRRKDYIQEIKLLDLPVHRIQALIVLDHAKHGSSLTKQVFQSSSLVGFQKITRHMLGADSPLTLWKITNAQSRPLDKQCFSDLVFQSL